MSLINEFSIQLHSLREDADRDFFGVLKMLSDIGYTGVEFAGYWDKSSSEMKKALDMYNLKSVGSHISLDKLQNELDKELEYNNIIGTKYIVCPWSDIKTKEDTLILAEKLNKISEKCTKAGFKFAYHNHNHEFVKDGTQYLLDILFENVDKSKVFMEIDLYWVAYAGLDAMKYIEQNKDIVKLLHIKQIKDNETKECVDLDEGILDFKTIINKAKSFGVEHFILEQEKFEKSSYISVQKGFSHIMEME